MSGSSTYKTSDNTGYKQWSLKFLLHEHMDIVQTIWRKHPYMKIINGTDKIRPYRYFDLHGGYGRDENGNSGSPLIFCEAAQECKIPFIATIFEQDASAHDSLKQCLDTIQIDSKWEKIHLFNEDHHRLIGEYAVIPDRDTKLLRDFQYGIAYSDPSNADPSFDVLRAIGNAYPKLDFIINLAAASYKRTRHLDNYVNLQNALLTIRPVWHVRKPVDTHQWTMLLGTSWKGFPDWEKKGFAKFDSELGKEWFEQIVFTRNEIRAMRQHSMFDFVIEQKSDYNQKKVSEYGTYEEYLKHPKFLAVRQQAMEQAHWVCQVCKKTRAISVHHIKYPPWGEFDVVENLVPICHKCHCEIHGKEN